MTTSNLKIIEIQKKINHISDITDLMLKTSLNFSESTRYLHGELQKLLLHYDCNPELFIFHPELNQCVQKFINISIQLTSKLEDHNINYQAVAQNLTEVRKFISRYDLCETDHSFNVSKELQCCEKKLDKLNCEIIKLRNYLEYHCRVLRCIKLI